MKIFYSLDKENLSASFWAENAPENKVIVKGRWQTYAGARAEKNNTRIIFSNLPAFCEPQQTITLNPNTPEGSFTPKLNTKTHTGGATSRKVFEYVKAVELVDYLQDENDKQAYKTLLDKAKQVFDKRQAEANKTQIDAHIKTLEKLGLTPDRLFELLKLQQTQASKTQGGENE